MTDPRPSVAQDDPDALETFIGKWRARWPEWSVAEVFVPPAQRTVALAWASLQQELTDAAWSGSDPRPGEAKLAWWQEELQGWALGRRRHPLGITLQRQPAPWAALAAALPTLRESRERPLDSATAFAQLMPLATAAAA
ncbi:MAG: phytoene/squalene synthase family protein, partial [Lysobacter sp.]